MALPWTGFESEIPHDNPHSPYGIRFWVKEAVLLPCRGAGLVCVLCLVLGGLFMWTLPTIADRHKIDTSLLVLRVIDDESAVRPFRRLNYENAVTDRFIELKGEVSSVQTKRTKRGYTHTIQFADGVSKEIKATTPLTTIPREELEAARDAVSTFFSPENEKEWKAVLAWGENIFLTCWLKKYELGVINREQFTKVPGGTEEERLWCVWQVLKSGGAPEEDLTQLPKRFREAFPTKKERETALDWAQTFHERLVKFRRLRQSFYHVSRTSKTGREGRLAAYQALDQVVPPKCNFTHLWLLQQYVGLSPVAREAARKRWCGYFPESRQEQLTELGKELVAERQRNSEALPNAPEVLPSLCVIERLTGTDRLGEAACEGYGELSAKKLVASVVILAYPNDDLFYLKAAGDPLHLYSIYDTTENVLATTATALALAALTSLGVVTTLRWFLAPWLLRGESRKLWKKHLEGRGKERWWLQVASLLVCTVFGALTARFGMADIIAVQIGSVEQLFLGALLATTAGGVLIGTLRRIASLFFIKCGVDVEETWADEIVGIALAGIALYHFGNGFLAIALFALSDLIPGLISTWWHRGASVTGRAVTINHSATPQRTSTSMTTAEIDALFGASR